MEDVEPYLYMERRIAEYNEAQIADVTKAGGTASRGLGSNEFGIAGIQRMSNGNMQITVSNGLDSAEVFAYTVWHTSSVSVVVWTNEYDEVLTNSYTAWHPAAPAFDGIESEWEYGATNLTLSGGVGVWEDANVSSNARVRFYAAARRIDSDADGLSDGAEVLIHRTDPVLADTDEDGHSDGREVALGTDPMDGTDYFGILINAALPIPPPPGSEVGREWVELFNAGLGTKSLAGFRLQTALPAGWSNVFTFPAGVTLDSGDFMVIGNGTNGDFQANLYLPNSSFNPPGVFGIRLVKPDPVFHVADALFYGFTNEFGFSLDGFGEQLPIVRPRTNWVVRRTWVGFDTDHPGNWKNVPASLWPPHRQGEHLDLDGDGLSNAEELAGGLFPIEGGTRIDEADSDFDGISDADELALGTDPNNVDTDGDAFPWSESSPPSGSDADELSNGTDPLNPDSDGDGIPDGWELAGGLDPLSPDSDGNGMPDGDEDSDGDGVPNAVEVANLTNPFDADDVDPRPYIWLKDGQIIEDTIDEGDIGYLTTLVYHIKAQSNCPPIMVRVVEGGHVVESFSATCSVRMDPLNSGEHPATNRVFYITPNGQTHFTFRVIDEGTVWPNENPDEYGADIVLTHAPAILDLDAGVPEASEETVGFLLASKNAHDDAQRRVLSIHGPENTWGYAGNIVLTYDTARLRIYDEEDNILASGTQFYEGDRIPALEVEGLAHSGAMRDAWINVAATGVPVSDRVNATVLKADIGTVGPLADRTLHPDAARQPLTLKQTLPSGWNGLMTLSWSGAVAYWTPTGGTPIVSGSVFSNALLPQTIYLEGDGCGTNEAVFSVIGLSDCVTNIPLQIFGVNATLAGVAELDEESPGGFIADRSVHTNAPRTALTLEAFGPYGAPGHVALSWNSSYIQLYPSASGGSALSQYSVPYAGFTGATFYVEGIAPAVTSIEWGYSEIPDCVDEIKVTVIKVQLKELAFTNNHTIVKDDGSQSYTAPHWQDNAPPHPLCFTRDTKMMVDALWRIEPADTGVVISAKGVGPGNLLFPATSAAISGHDMFVLDMECDEPFPDEVAFYNPMVIDWLFSFDGGYTWLNAGVSDNQTYVTLGSPLTTVYHTLAHLGCINAAGEYTASGCTLKIWDEFTDLDVRRIDNTQLTYYSSYLCTNVTTADLLKHGDGQCGAWARLFIDIRKVQGIDDYNEYIVFRPIPPAGIPQNYVRIAVKNWVFSGAGSSGNTNFPYLNIPDTQYIDATGYNWLYSEANDAAGVPGQGNPNPASLFNNHQVVISGAAFQRLLQQEVSLKRVMR
jgi:hypothetical protein